MKRRIFLNAIFTLSSDFLFCHWAIAHQDELAAFARPLETPQTAIRPSPREGHCLVYDEHHRRVILLDGYQKPHQPERGEIWGWKGKDWKLIPGSGPSARSLSAAAFDSRRKKIVLHGGIGNTGYDDLRGDTWEWDGKAWREMSDTTVGTRDHHVMAYDAARGKTLMYGGIASSRALPANTWKWATDMWEWDGMKWTRIAAPGPGGRTHFAMVYDSKRKKIVLFGGMGEDRRYHNDTWTWDGKTWTKVSTDGPAPRARHRMAFDRRAGIVLLCGGDGVKAAGQRDFNVLQDTWSWNGRTWTEIKSADPGKRFMHAMTYDSARNRIVLYGGSDGHQTLDDTWEWDGRHWARIK